MKELEYILFTDETNQQPSLTSKFFIYGGVFIRADRFSELHDTVEAARHDHGFLPDDGFKFDTHSRPSHVTRENHAAAKKAVLTACDSLAIRFTACLVLHDIAKNCSLKELVERGANTVIAAFHRFLEEQNTYGICVMDRLPFKHNFQYLREKFHRGLALPGGGIVPLNDRILLFASSCNGASHAASAIDIILGAFRFCVNERKRDALPRTILPIIVRMMWHRHNGGTLHLREYGLLFRPKGVLIDSYKQEYEELTQHFERLLALSR
ncbi:MAG: hypothetical protein ACFFCW_09360 [Candidatus Hodarchaeota archaeon]